MCAKTANQIYTEDMDSDSAAFERIRAGFHELKNALQLRDVATATEIIRNMHEGKPTAGDGEPMRSFTLPQDADADERLLGKTICHSEYAPGGDGTVAMMRIRFTDGSVLRLRPNHTITIYDASA